MRFFFLHITHTARVLSLEESFFSVNVFRLAVSDRQQLIARLCVCLCCSEGGDVVKVAQLASITSAQSRIAQTETPVTLQFQGNKFTLSPSQLRQLTTGQPLQLQGTVRLRPVFLLLLPTSSVHRGFWFSPLLFL